MKAWLLVVNRARIMRIAGESGDRWRVGREAARWRKVRTPPFFETDRATRLVTPGGWIREDSATDSATETKPPVRNALGGQPEAIPLAGQFSDAQARVKRWGKSPPLRWRHRRHGKPRVEQGQIGG